MARKKHNRRRKRASKVVKEIRIQKAIDKLILKLPPMDEEEFNSAKQRAQSRAAIQESLQQTYKKVKSISTSSTVATTVVVAGSSQVNTIKRGAPQDSSAVTVTASSVVSNQTNKRTKTTQINDDFHSASGVVVDDIEGLLSIDGTRSSGVMKATTTGSNDGRAILNNIVDAVIVSIFDDDSSGTTTPHNNNNTPTTTTNNNNVNYRNSTEYIRMKQFYKDAIRGKALILQNTAKQLKASQYKHKHKNIHKRRNILSNTQMKKLHRCDPLQLPPPEFIQEMHQHWWNYAKQVVFNSQSDAQLQARVHVMELVGARITILDAIVKQLIGRGGIITACSLNCYYVAFDDSGQNKDDGKQEDAAAVNAVKLHKRKVGTAIVIKAPDGSSTSSIVADNNPDNNNNNMNNNNNNTVTSIHSNTECLDDDASSNKNSNNKKAPRGGDALRQPNQPMKATQLVRAHVVIGVMLPVHLVRGKRTTQQSSYISSYDATTTTRTTAVTAAATSITTSCSSDAGDSGDHRDDDDDGPVTEDVQVAVLYGKRFMPHAL